MIPKNLLQSSYYKLPQYVNDQLMKYASGWKYHHYTNDEMITYFIDNPLDEFPNIIQKFHDIQAGPHKADLFRYYWLYINGGMYLDSDIMLTTDLDNIVKDYEFVSARSIVAHTILNGVLGATPHHPAIYWALRDSYDVNTRELEENYSLLCKNLYLWMLSERWFDRSGVKMYREKDHSPGVYKTIGDNNETLLLHYQKTKVIPRE